MTAPLSGASTLNGTGVVPGVAFAPVMWTHPRPEVPSEGPVLAPEEQPGEVERLQSAARAVAARLDERAERQTGHTAEVLAATAALARDKGWISAARKHIGQGDGAPVAVGKAIATFVATFESMGGLMAERTTDLRDIRDRVVAELTGAQEPGVPAPSEPAILCADDLAPADTAGLDPTRVVGIATRSGGPTSHTAIIARQHGIPCVVGVDELYELRESEPVLVDGTQGTITRQVAAEVADMAVREDARRRERIAAWEGPAATADGTSVDLLANVQDGPGARTAAQGQARGIGLFRTELLFLTAQSEPAVADQATRYAEVFAAFPGHKVVLRTLDAGSDKPLAFASLPNEPNPALGVRGVRLARLDEGLLLRQLDAVAEAVRVSGSASQNAWVMAPMIATVAEARSFATAVRERGLRAGVMIEVPSVALQAPEVMAEVDFVSIGTNDLTQYVMAADRMSAQLTELTDPWQPAVLRLVRQVAHAGQTTSTPVGVCGEAAADPDLACVLVGMGVTSLSVAAGAVSVVGERLGRVSDAQCEQAASAAVAATDPAEARQAAIKALAQ